MDIEDENPLSFNEFFEKRYIIQGTPIIRSFNFIGHWKGGLAEIIYRESSYCKRFRENHPELDKFLLDQLNKPNRDYKLLNDEELRQKLYDAYIIMFGYGIPNKTLLR